MNPSFKYVYTIRAKHSCGGGDYYFCSCGSQPSKMLEFSYSLAFIYRHRYDAEKAIFWLKQEYKGLTDWTIEYRKITKEEHDRYFDKINHGFGINRY